MGLYDIPISGHVLMIETDRMIIMLKGAELPCSQRRNSLPFIAWKLNELRFNLANLDGFYYSLYLTHH